MDLSDQSFNRFLELVYEAAEKPEQWRRLYEELQVAVGVKSIHMLGVDKRHGTLSYSDGANMPVQGELAYLQHYRFQDPRWPIIMQRGVGEWTHCHEDLAPDVPATHPFYQEFLVPYDRRYMSATKLVDSPEATVVFSMLRGDAQGPLPADAQAFVQRLLPHLQRACRIGIRNFVYSTQALVGHLLVSKLRQPVLLMTLAGEVLHANEAASALMRSTPLVQVADGRLKLPGGQLKELLAQCAQLEQAVKAQQSREGGAPADASPSGDAGDAHARQFRSLRILPEQPGGEPVYAFFTVLSPEGAMGSFGLRPVVMLVFYHPASAPTIDSGLLYAVFGLTPAECRIATLLAEGLSLKQIAQAQGTQPETVRKQLRSIYQKTATNRQPELIRLLLHLPHNAIRQ
jgi:DNA-binding CsgD family transcriptional regulator